MRILIFGDGIAQGFFDSKGGWAALIANDYHQATLQNLDGERTLVFNLGISGDRVQDVLDRLEDEAKARLSQDSSIIVLAVGIHDAVLQENIAVSDVYEFQKIYEKVIDKAQKLSDKILCVGLSAVDEELANPWQYSATNKQWLNNRINLFEDTIKQSAIRKNLPFVPVHDKFLRMLEQKRPLLADGLHPNDAGHEIIASLVKLELERLLQ